MIYTVGNKQKKTRLYFLRLDYLREYKDENQNILFVNIIKYL